MPRMRGIGDYIPASGEARALVEVKGRVGGKGAGMRRTRRSKFSNLRKMPKGREADWVIPLGRGINPVQSAGDQLHFEQITPGAVTGTLSRFWQFVLHPGLRPDQGTTPQLPWVAGLEENSDSARYRVMAMQGDLYWTPQFSNDEDITPSMCTGFIAGAWYKLKRSNAIDIDSDGSTIVNPPFRGQFPWRSLSVLDGIRMAAEESGYGVPDGLVGTVDYLPGGQLEQQDWRLVQHASPIGQFVRPWRADFIPTIVGCDDTGQPTTVITIPQIGPAQPVKLPMPRRLVANIGRDEALGLYLMVWNNLGSTSNRAPEGLLTYPTFRVKLLELD